ncbi:MAG: hypothetical protein PUJ82_13775 [Spirochaetales bacterium]|nr:hypothetical protein [Spirochaetales bacterium]MDY5914600.1 hypothetical protein [Treponema sp.]
MSVPKHKRKLSEMEFYRQTMDLYRDVTMQLLVNFEKGLYKDRFETVDGTEVITVEKYPQDVVNYIKRHAFEILGKMADAVTVANSIYPTTLEECRVRRNIQNEAIGYCNALLTHYEYMAAVFPRKTTTLMNYADRTMKLQGLMRHWKQSTAKFEKQIKEKELK